MDIRTLTPAFSVAPQITPSEVTELAAKGFQTVVCNGVTSNYRRDLAPYTWELVRGLKHERAVFTQPPMPIKCTGAPQKAMYLSADNWRDQGRLKDNRIDFFNAGGVLFAEEKYVPALMHYVERYGFGLNFQHNLTRVDGPARAACLGDVCNAPNAKTAAARDRAPVVAHNLLKDIRAIGAADAIYEG